MIHAAGLRDGPVVGRVDVSGARWTRLEGVPAADCRVNGEDWEKGMQALREYARTWPAAGYEFRKQYVVLQSIQDGA